MIASDTTPIRSADRFAEFLSHYAISSSVRVSEERRDRRKTILIDSFAAAMAALKHPAALAVRRYASSFVSDAALCAIWGTSRRTSAEVVALSNGVLRFSNIGQVVLKHWPVGSRAQSAIQAALDARRQIEDVRDIDTINTTKPVRTSGAKQARVLGANFA